MNLLKCIIIENSIVLKKATCNGEAGFVCRTRKGDVIAGHNFGNGSGRSAGAISFIPRQRRKDIHPRWPLKTNVFLRLCRLIGISDLRCGRNWAPRSVQLALQSSERGCIIRERKCMPHPASCQSAGRAVRQLGPAESGFGHCEDTIEKHLTRTILTCFANKPHLFVRLPRHLLFKVARSAELTRPSSFYFLASMHFTLALRMHTPTLLFLFFHGFTFENVPLKLSCYHWPVTFLAFFSNSLGSWNLYPVDLQRPEKKSVIKLRPLFPS